MAQIVIPYKPRDAFGRYHDNDKRFSLTVAHRRAGKTVARINKLIRKAVECDKPNPRFGYLAPYYVQAKDIAWIYLKHYSAPLIALGGKVNESELTVTFPHNNAIIKLYGAENAERMRGLYFDGIVIDEGQGIAPSVLTAIILPALADRLGWLDVSGTPKGWENLLGELARIAARDKDEWFFEVLKASETGIIPETELKRQRQLMPQNEYEQEFECSFDAAITGAIYGAWMAGALLEGRIGVVPYAPELPVNTAWDLGYDDSTSVWFWQIAKNEIRLIGYYEAAGEDIAHYCDYLKERVWAKNYGAHYVPHDAANKLLAAGGRSIYQQMTIEHGLKHVRIVPATSQQNSIEAARKTLEICWFDESCGRGIAALKNYQYEFDDDKKTFRSKPRHDWASHGSDAFEIIGQVWRTPVEKPQPEPLKGQTQMTIAQMIAQQKRKRINQE